jgi:ABC-2 type transport system permease protein
VSSNGRVDVVQLKALLRAYLRMSANGATLLRARGKPTTLAAVLAIYALLGLFIGLAGLLHPKVYLLSIGLHGITFFTVGMSAIIESNDVLFDPQEDEILLHRPISPATLIAAKGLALVGFTMLLAGALNLFPTFFLLAAQGAHPWIPIVHLVSTALLVVCVCAAVVCSYGLILRLFGREKFENLAVIAQIAMTLFLVGGSQILPRVLRRVGPERLEEFARYLLPSPPAWFAAIDTVLAGGEHDVPILLAAGTGVLATVLLAWLGVGKLASGYGAPLPVRGQVAERADAAERSDIEGRDALEHPRGASSATSRPFGPLLRHWVRDPIERSAFRLAVAYLKRDREIKLRFYPSLGVFVVLAALTLVDSGEHTSQFLPVMMLAMTGTIPFSTLETMRMSSHHAAADVFRAAPIESSAPIFHGVRKAVIAFVEIPVACVAVLLLLFRSPSPASGIALAIPVLVALPTMSLAPGLFGSYLPLSMEPRRGRQSGQHILVVLGTLAFAGTLIGLSELALRGGLLEYFVPVEIAGVAFVHVLLLRVIRRRRLSSWATD